MLKDEIIIRLREYADALNEVSQRTAQTLQDLDSLISELEIDKQNKP